SDIIDLSYFPPVVNQIELHPLLNQSELRAVHSERSILTGAYIPTDEGKLADNPAIAEVAAAHGKSPAQVLIRWSLQQGDIVVPRSAAPAQIAENADVFDFELTAAEMETLNGLDDGTRFLPNPGT
ncbi:MAG: aldo/keto reductase, partial [Mycolicibacterium aromaticivorans]|nr:aldo/keto reductase [Mycolicibacterium aromaticivorans]